jgi:translocator protein
MVGIFILYISNRLQNFTFSVIFIRKRESIKSASQAFGPVFYLLCSILTAKRCHNYFMNQSTNTTDRLRAVLVLISTVGTIVFNGLAATGYVNGVTPQVISERYPTVVTPAGYAFTIWSLIYVGMLAFSVYQLLPAQNERFRKVRTVYIISCLLNCGWIFFWHRDQIAVSLGMILALLASLLVMLIQFRNAESPGSALLTKATFGIYAGWVTAASIVNFVILLKSMNVELSASGWNTLGVVCIVLAAAAAVVVRASIKNFLYPLAIAWAVGAIAVKQSGNTPIVVAAAFAAVVCLVTSGSIVTQLKDSTSGRA